MRLHPKIVNSVEMKRSMHAGQADYTAGWLRWNDKGKLRSNDSRHQSSNEDDEEMNVEAE